MSLTTHVCTLHVHTCMYVYVCRDWYGSGKPWCRVAAFLIGVMMAFYQCDNATKSGHLRPPGLPVMSIGYCLALVIFFVCVFTPYVGAPLVQAH